MSVVVRRYKPDDRTGYAQVRSRVYRGGGPVGVDEKLIRDDSNAYVALLDDQIVGTSAVLRMTCTKGEEILSCGGVASVGVLPNIRRGGVGSELMRGTNRMMREEGYALASLYAYREPFYRRFGYEVVGKRFLIKAPTHRLPKITSDLPIRELQVSQYAELHDVMRAMGTRYAGYNVHRSADHWWRTTGGDTPMAIYVAGDPIEAFAVVRLRDDFWETVEVRETAWKSNAGYNAILALFSRIAMNHDAIEWCEPGDSPFLYTYADQAIEYTVNRPIMFRVLNVETCLRSLLTLEDATIEIDDPDFPENSGVWDVSTASRTTREPELILTIQQFTQAFLGDPSIVSIARQTDQPLSRGLFNAFSAQPVYCADFF